MVTEANISESAPFPPRPVCVAAALAIAVGVGSVIGMIAGLAVGTFTFDLGFVGVPTGYGLLIGRSSARKWALFFATAGCVLITGFGVWAAYDHYSGRDPLFYPDGAYSYMALGLACLGCVYVFLVLRNDGHREWFGDIKEDRAATKSFAWAVAIVSAVLLVSHHAEKWWVRETHARIYPFRVEVSPYDSVSGEGVSSFSYESDTMTRETGFPRMSVATIGGTEGIRIEYSGVATHPVELLLRSEGYEDKPITIDQDTKEKIRVAMRPLGNGKAGSRR